MTLATLSLIYSPIAETPLRILLADDNPVLLVAIRGLLERLGHSVEVVKNGREAIEAGNRSLFDFVFLDIQMPEVDGFDAARSLRSSHQGGPSPRIIGLSGCRITAEAREAAGMDDFLLKPVRLADLQLLMR